MQMPFSGPDYKLGLDLSWGIELDYKVDLSEVEQEEWYDANRKNSVLEWLKSIIDRRIETLWINDSVITWASYGGEEHIIVQIPLKWNDALQNSDNIERAKAAIGKVVKIEFKELRDDVTDADIDYENIVSETTTDIEAEFTLTGSWQSFTQNILENGLSSEILTATNPTWTEWYLVFKMTEGEFSYLFLDTEPSIWMPATAGDGRVLNDRYFVNSSVQQNSAFQPLVELTFNSEWAQIFGELTRRLVGEPMAIFVGGELLTAPTINEAILTWRAVITWDYTLESAAELAQNINTWVVPAPIYLTSERTIDAKLGQSSLQKIIYAGLFGFVSILLFLMYIYRFSWLIAAVALFVYIVITLAILKQFGIVLTLASIAWLVLSIGIAIDANILIFERIKDELRRWEDLRESVRVGFDKSFSAIWDANVTGLIVAIILFIFGINMIKWFGFILALGIVVSLFSVFFISRLFIRFLARSEVNEKHFIWKL